MTRRAAILVLFAGCAVPEVGEHASRPHRPNVLFVLTDDHATAALGAYGSSFARTPHLDRLAAEGVLFENAFCTNAICAPSRAVFLTGRHSAQNGVRTNGDVFDASQPTFPAALRAAGYQTALFGKWHLKSDPGGFDHWEVLPGQGHYYAPDFESAAGSRRIPGYVTDVVTDLALEWLHTERDPARPFLLMVQHKAPHRSWMPGPEHLDLYDDVEIPEPPTLFDDYATRSDAARLQEMEIDRHMYLEYDLKVPPLDPDVGRTGPDRWAQGLLERMSPEERAAWEAAFAEENDAFRSARLTGDELVRWKYQRYLKNYLRCIASVDDNVGRLLAWLDEQGLAEDTVVVYASDQGFFLGEHGWYDKRFAYEPALRLPLIVSWPGVTPAGSRARELVQNLDLAATMTELAGAEPLPGDEGASLVPLLRGESPEAWRDAIDYEYYEVGIHAVEPHVAVRTARHKLIHFHRIDQWELYDLETDPQELRNRFDDPAMADVRVELIERLERRRAALSGSRLAPGGQNSDDR